MTLAYGERESPEFQRQARDLAATLDTTGRLARIIRVDGLNHFEVLDTLGRSDAVLARAALAPMGLG